MKFISERVENTVEIGEIAGYQDFLLFPQCFQMTSISGLLKVGIVLTLYHTIPTFNHPDKENF